MEAKSENIWDVIITTGTPNGEELIRHGGIRETRPRERCIEKLITIE